MSKTYEPKPEHKFTFGLWTVGNMGRDPFGGTVRESKTPAELVYLLGEVGAYGVNFHDNDLIPIDATPAEADAIKKAFRKALADTGLVVPMATTNLFGDPIFKDGAFTSNDPKVRAYAIQKTMNAIDLGVEFGAKTYVFWGGREGTETDSSKSAVEAIKRNREAIYGIENCPVKRRNEFISRIYCRQKNDIGYDNSGYRSQCERCKNTRYPQMYQENQDDHFYAYDQALIKGISSGTKGNKGK
jgi:hypothetical protein